METDLDVLNQARNSVLYGGKKSPLVEWTLSKEWSQVPTKLGVRGDVRLSGQKVAGRCNDCAGEIDAG